MKLSLIYVVDENTNKIHLQNILNNKNKEIQKIFLCPIDYKELVFYIKESLRESDILYEITEIPSNKILKELIDSILGEYVTVGLYNPNYNMDVLSTLTDKILKENYKIYSTKIKEHIENPKIGGQNEEGFSLIISG